MKNGASEQKVRERILSNGYGKFDLVEDILTKDEILNWKPRIVLKILPNVYRYQKTK